MIYTLDLQTDIAVRSGDVIVYDSEEKKNALTNKISISNGSTKYVFNCTTGIITDTVYFYITNQQRYFGLQNIQIHGYRIIGEIENKYNANELLDILNYDYSVEDLKANNELLNKVLKSNEALNLLIKEDTIEQKIQFYEDMKNKNKDTTLLVSVIGIQEFSQPQLTSDSTSTSDGVISVTTGSQQSTYQGYKAFLNTVTTTVNNNFYSMATTSSTYLKITYPYRIYITGIDMYSRPRDNYVGKVSAYTDESRTTCIAPEVSMTNSATKYIMSIRNKVLTDTVYFYITNQQTYFGLQNIQVHGYKLIE